MIVRAIGKHVVVSAVCASLLLPLASAEAPNPPAPANAAQTEAPAPPLEPTEASMRTYADVSDRWAKLGYADATNEASASAGRLAAAAPGVGPAERALDGKAAYVALERSGDWAEFEIEVPADGLYQLEIEYYTLGESYSPAQIAVRLDGDVPFEEAGHIQLQRVWKDAVFPPRKNERGDDIRPVQEQLPGWRTTLAQDMTSAYEEPFRWFLQAGTRRVRIESVFEPVAIARIGFKPPERIPNDEAAAGDRMPDGGDWSLTLEAERMARKSDPSVQIQPSHDNLAEPKSEGRYIFNVLGGERWNRGGQWAEWEFEVPEDGVYYIHFKYLQSFVRDAASFRKISIDGKVPFRELLAYPFPFGRNWGVETLRGPGDAPFGFALEAGTHTLRMEATESPVREVRETVRTVMAGVQELYRTVGMVTGVKHQTHVDSNRDWNLEAYIPDIRRRFADMADALEAAHASLRTLYGTDADHASGLITAVNDLRRLADDPNLLPNRPTMLFSMQETLGSFADALSVQPLSLDRIYITRQPAAPAAAPGAWDVLKDNVANFLRTFDPDYQYYGKNDPDGIDVWVNRGRDYVTLMQQLADETFTPATGIKVNVNIMPNPGLLMLSNASGREPDVALGIAESLPVDFAMRNALVDLSLLPGYEDVARSFHPGSIIPFQFDGGTYALPETIGFNVMFYRKDILEQLGLTPPDTWEQVYKMLPTLQQNGYDFFFTPLNYLPFFMQNGVEFYSDDGLESGLGTPEGFDAFKQWTDLFNVYGFPLEVPNFYMHFRNGDMPIGISDYNTYMQLLVAAPELTGSWGLAPIPGVADGDGDVVRWAGGNMTSGMIFRSSERKEDAWKFLSWWTSDDTQARFGTEIEMINGVEFRWNTANVNAFKRLPWPKEDARSVMLQWEWYKEMPIVPGGYFTLRELPFAWNRTVLANVNFRESLEQSIFEINRELMRKQREFGFVDETGRVVKPLKIPKLSEPWEVADD